MIQERTITKFCFLPIMVRSGDKRIFIWFRKVAIHQVKTKCMYPSIALIGIMPVIYGYHLGYYWKPMWYKCILNGQKTLLTYE